VGVTLMSEFLRVLGKLGLAARVGGVDLGSRPDGVGHVGWSGAVGPMETQT